MTTNPPANDAAATAHARKMETQRVRIAAWHDAGLCNTCGRTPREGKLTCQTCTVRAEVARQRRIAAAHAKTLADPDAPACRHCGSRDLARRGRPAAVPLYNCRACGRRTDTLADPAPDQTCPHCGARCVKSGHNARGRAYFLCTACGRRNTNLWPAPDTSPGGLFPHKMTFYLGPLAFNSINRYCQAHKMSIAQAIRHIFRAAVSQGGPKWAVSRQVYDPTWDEYRTVITRPKPSVAPPIPANTRVPDIRSQTTTERMKQGRFHRPVAQCFQASVALDDLAKQGLLRTMQVRCLNHQQAARALIGEAI